MKLVKRGSQPISGDTGLLDIKALAESGDFKHSDSAAGITPLESRPAYLAHLLSYIDVDALAGLKIVCNAGNGGAGLVIDALEPLLQIEFTKVFNQPDGNFPSGVPNPLLIENRESTARAVRETGVDFGVAWDGDFDRCFFFDEAGGFVEGYYLVGLFAQALLQENLGETIIHDPRLVWNTLHMVESLGTPLQSKAGHAFIKERMREENAIYAGEMSGHYYFRDFSYCDSGMIPWLLLIDIMVKNLSLIHI